MDKLLNCPFCGGEANLNTFSRHGHFCSCNKCGAETEVGTTLDKASWLWNRRAMPEGCEGCKHYWELHIDSRLSPCYNCVRRLGNSDNYEPKGEGK